MLANCRINKDGRTHLRAETAGLQAGCARVPNLTLGLTFLRSHCNAVSATHQDPTLGQFAMASLAFKFPLWEATLLCVRLPQCWPPILFLCRILHFHPLPEFTPPVCHRLLPPPFGPLLVWIRRLRLGGLPTSGHLEDQVIFFQLPHVHNEMSFPSGNFLLRLILLLYSCDVSSPIFIFTKLFCLSNHLRFNSLQHHPNAIA